MKPVLTREEAHALDAHTIAAGVPGVLLMENAGRGAANVLEKRLLGGSFASKRIVIVTGPGNNGGDGFVVARHAVTRRASVSVLHVGDIDRVRGDARVMLD